MLSCSVALYLACSRALMVTPFVGLSELALTALVLEFAGCVFAFEFAFEFGAG